MEKGRDFSAALLSQAVVHTGLGKAGRVRHAAKQDDGERRFVELRKALEAGSFQRVSPEEGGGSFNESTSGFVDCSDKTIDDMNLKGGWGSAQSYGRELYNGYYTFDEYDSADGQRCIYMQTPFRRGLRVDEAAAIIEAMQMDMGFTEQRKIELGIERELPAEESGAESKGN